MIEFIILMVKNVTIPAIRKIYVLNENYFPYPARKIFLGEQSGPRSRQNPE
tara:strand:+ start:164 stop:316 length:153 start_codon:yes stop_codon:yes gene_type:complete